MEEGSRIRSPQNIIEEMKFLQKDFHINFFQFQDELLMTSKERTENFCLALLKAKIDMRWGCNGRLNFATPDVMRLMKQAGFVRMAIGVESGNEHILELIQKKVKLQEIRDCFKMLKEVGIATESFAMIGLPGETKKTMRNTARFLRSIPEIRYTSLGLVIPYPGTMVYEYAKTHQHGLRLLSEDYREYHRYGKGVMEVDGMSPKELVRMQKRMVVMAHLSPYKIYSLIRHFGFFSLFKTYFEWFFEALLPNKRLVGPLGANKWREEHSPGAVHFAS